MFNHHKKLIPKEIAMTNNNYNTKGRKFNHLNYENRKLIEKLLSKNVSKKEIAELLEISRSTLYNELKRGTVIQLNSDLTEYKKYFAETGQLVYEKNRNNSKKPYKFTKAINFIEDVEKEIIENKLSPDSACGKLKRTNKYEETVCFKTIYNYIDLGLSKVKNIDLILKVKINHHKNKIRKNRRIMGDSIENRPEIINNRKEIGHWEIDTVIGKREKGSVLLTIDERATRKRIIVKIKDKTATSVMEGLQKTFSRFKEPEKVFKSITSDNGSEFAELTQLSSVHIYYTHPYTSWERGTNEKQNSLIRRFLPKGTSFDDIDDEVIERIQEWINNFPRKMFGYATSNELFKEEMNKIGISV